MLFLPLAAGLLAALQPQPAPPQPHPPEVAASPGLTLRDLQERARKSDPRVQQAQAQLENAHGKRDEARWAWFPNFETTAYIGGPTPEHLLMYGDNDPEPGNPSHLTPGSRGDWFHGRLGVQIHADVQAIMPLWTWGKLTAGRTAVGHLVGANEALLQRARDQAAFDMARAYWGYQTARNADDAVEKLRAQLRDAKQTAQRLLKEKSDQISRSDAMKLDYLSEEIEAMHAQALKNRDLALTGLRLLAGAAPEEPLQIVQQDLPPPPQPPPAGDVLARALERRPEVRAASEGVKARAALVDLERGKLYPDIGLVVGARFTETTNASNPPSPFVFNPYHELSPYAAIGLRATLDVPQKLARVRQVEADLREVMALRRGAEQLVRLEVQQALGDLTEARVRAERYTRETAIAKQLTTQASVAFDSGLGEARELLEGTLLYARADGERFRALFDAQMAWAALEKAAGGPVAP